MSDALPLRPHPSLEQYKKRAKELVKICKSGDRDALGAWVREWIEALVKFYDLDITLPREGHRAYTPAEIGYRIERTVDRVTKHVRASNPPSRSACTLAQAQLAIAREHGFASWPKFAKHVEGLARAHPPISAFEAAVDAIVSGDLATLEKLLRENPTLVRTRSTREHRSTLLHYVSANGVEDFRQKTPRNIVEITKLLLLAGADVNAESDAYGGRSTTLGLTATSYHPEAAGVQLALLDLLIEHGAIIDGPDGGSAVNGCLHNGRGQAAEFLAACGARLDLEGAAGVGRLEDVKRFFNDDGSLKPTATPNQMKAGFAWACEFGRTGIVDFLLQQGMEVAAKLNQEGGETGLHWAAYAGHADVVRLLLEHGAPVDVKDKRHDGTPLDWALYGWGTSPDRADLQSYLEVVARLARAGAKLDPEWYEDDEDRKRAAKKMQSNPRMRAALRGQMPPKPATDSTKKHR
jgi:ankyrin repeat protein